MKTKIILLFGFALIMSNCRPPSQINDTGVKVGLPLALELKYNESDLANEIMMPFTVKTKPLSEVFQISNLVEAQGSIQIQEFNQMEREHLAIGEEFVGDGVFQIVGEGQGELSVSVIAYDEAGQTLYERTITHYFWVTPRKVYVGNNGIIQLELEALDDELGSGLVSDTTYQETRESILGGGAIESITIMTPTP